MAKIIAGQPVFDTLKELVNPGHTALAIIDMQKDFCYKDGYFDRQQSDYTMIRDILPRLRELIYAARNAGVLLAYFRQTISLSNGKVLESPAYLHFSHKAISLEDSAEPDFFTVDNSWGQEIADEIKPMPGEIVIDKHKPSGFMGTNFDMLLRSNGMKTVICTGCVTQGCVETTLRDATNYDYYSILIEDCVASQSKILHDAALTVMKARWTTLKSEDLIAVWKESSIYEKQHDSHMQ